MSLARDFRILKRMALGARSGSDDHGQRMESFYAEQAQDYDDFRKRLLPGRAELLEELDWPEQASVVDLGGGTGANLDYLTPDRHQRLQQWTIVDLSASLLAIAEARVRDNGWNHVQLVQADAGQWQPPQQVDIVLLSYSLTMIPDWQAVLQHAHRILKPGGQIAVVDFTVADKNPLPGGQASSALSRFFWPKWFAWDGVYLNPEHLPALMQLFARQSLIQQVTRLPYLPGSRVPYFRFVGLKS